VVVDFGRINSVDLNQGPPLPNGHYSSGLDLNRQSRLSARKELAKELGYTGDTGDSASMNVWLHKQVMTKLAANGGKVPADLKH